LARDKRKQVHGFVKPLAGTDTIPHVMITDSTRSKVTGIPFDVYYRTPFFNSNLTESIPISRSSPFSEHIQRVMRHCVLNGSDYFGPTTVSPLLYEGFYVPKEYACTERDAFVVTHVRGDKERKDVGVKITKNQDWLSRGVLGLTRFGEDGKTAVQEFFLNLSPSRLLKLLPSSVGVQVNFLSVFMRDWSNSKSGDKYDELNKFVALGVYESKVDVLLEKLRKLLPYETALMLLDTLFRYPYVERKYRIDGKKIITFVRFKISSDYETFSMDANDDPFGVQ